MVETMTRTRKQGVDEQAKQAVARTRLIRRTQKEDERQHNIQKILQNKIAYRNLQAQQKDEEERQMQVGLPQMGHKDDSQEKIQANPHQDQVFKAVKEQEHFRMGKEQEEQAKARQEHGYEMDMKEADRRVLEAANNPTSKKENDLNRGLTKEEKQMRAVFNNPNIPIDKKIKFFKNQLRAKKNRAALKTQRQRVQRGRQLVKKLQPKQKQIMRKNMTRLVQGMER